MKREDVLFTCTVVATSMAVIGTACSVALAYNLTHVAKDMKRAADNIGPKVEAAIAQRRSRMEGVMQ